MNAFIIGLLLVIVIYVGSRWMTSRTEIDQLRTHVAALKRQLARRER